MGTPSTCSTAEGIFQLSKLSLFHATCSVLQTWYFSHAEPAHLHQQNYKCRMGPVQYNWDTGPAPGLAVSQAWFPKPGNFRGQSLLCTPSTRSWSPMVRSASANNPLLGAAGEKQLSGIQLCDIQRRANLSSLYSPRHEHLHQLLIVPLSFSHTRLRHLGPGKLREQSKKSSNAMEEKISILLPSPTHHTTSIPEFKVKRQLSHQEPPKKASSSVSWRNVTSLVS